MISSPSRNVLITGATGALGSQVLRKFIESEKVVFATYFHGKPGQEHGVEWIKMDVTRPRDVEEGIARIGTVDVLVHCAGGFRFSPLEKLQDSDFDFLIDTNLKSAFFLCRSVLEGMKAKNFGRIVLIGSRSTIQPQAGMSAYVASKAGLNMLTLAVAEEVKEFNININCVLPTVIDTPANREDMPGADFGKWVSPKDLAGIILLLTQDCGKSIHGALIPVSGRI